VCTTVPSGQVARLSELPFKLPVTALDFSLSFSPRVLQGALVSDKWTSFKHSPPEDRRAASEPIGTTTIVLSVIIP
jgi:hypothetical protein